MTPQIKPTIKPTIKSPVKPKTPLAFALLVMLTLTACGGETAALSNPDLETPNETPKESAKSAKETLATLTAESINIAPPRVISEASAESDTEPTISIKTIKPKPKKPEPKEPTFKIASANISTISLPPPPPLLDIVTTADWLGDGATSFATAPSPTRDRNEFLQTTGMDLDSGGFATPTPTQRLNMKNGAGSLTLGGDLTDGVAFFTATPAWHSASLCRNIFWHESGRTPACCARGECGREPRPMVGLVSNDHWGEQTLCDDG